jgi:cytosine/adenosine deaminase-related metal-dependent hydrolase
VGRWRDLTRRHQGTRLDLGGVILLPGLVNAHCHLDYTHMAGLFPPPPSFVDFIKLITSEKATWSFSDFAHSWLDGAKMLLRTGTTTVGDVEAVPELLPEVWGATPLRVFSFLEMTGIRSRRNPSTILRENVETIDSLPTERCHAGLSPHAPYSTVPELLRLTATTARQRRWLVTTHIGESETEFEMFRRARGEMFEWLRRSQRDMSDCGALSPVQHVERHGLLRQNLLAIHVNYLGKGDAELLARRKVSVVHCPRSHDYFRHAPFPRRELTKAGVNVCLGTDSLATVRQRRRQQVELSMFEEMRALSNREPGMSAETIVRMATVNGARALGLKGMIGELRARAFPDLIAIPCPDGSGAPWEAVVHNTQGLRASMIGGRWVVPPATELAP